MCENQNLDSYTPDCRQDASGQGAAPRFHVRPLALALLLAGLAPALLGGCAMTDGKGGDGVKSSSSSRVTPLPLRVSGGDTADARYALGKYYFYQDRLEKAESAFLAAIQVDPVNVDALNGLGAVYDRMGRYDSAEKAYQAALRIAPEAAHVWANLGYSRILAGRGEEARAPLKAALRIDPGNSAARQRLDGLGAVPAQPEVAPVARVVEQVATPVSQPEPKSAIVSVIPPSQPAQAEATSGTSPIANIVTTAAAPPVAILVPPAVMPLLAQARDGGGNAPQPPSEVPAPSVAAEMDRSAPAPTAAPVLADTSAGVQPTAYRARPEVGGLRIEVSNGNGVTGMATALAGAMRKTGLNVARITNARPFTKAQTQIFCRPGQEAAAAQLAGALPAKPVVVVNDPSHRRVDVRIVLGKDSALAWREGEKAPYRMAKSERQGS